MLSSFDDFPIHQTSRPVAQTATSDINHYDRYFFNGCTGDTGLFFAAAVGLYPNRHVVDASFSVVVDGGTPSARQISVHASGRSPADRADANKVGPIEVEVLDPLHALRLTVDAADQGLRADLTFVRRTAPIEEPHFFQQVGVRLTFDYTRLTQFGAWEGWIEVDGARRELSPGDTLGCRDRSWGVRQVGERSATGAPVADPQFFWLWAPIDFGSFATHFDVNELFDGRRWHESAFIAPAVGPEGAAPPEAMHSVDYRVDWRPGTRTAAGFEMTLTPWVGEPTTVTLEPLFEFQMAGLGYLHPEWGHGVWKGEMQVGGERWTLPAENPTAPDRLHVQSIVRATTAGGLGEHHGIGILEQLAIGRHDPTGLTGIFDGWTP